MRGAWLLPLLLISCAGASRTASRSTHTTARSTTVARGPAPPVYTPVPLPGAIGGGPQLDLTGMELGPAGPIEAYLEQKTAQLREQCYVPSAGLITLVIDAEIAPDGKVRRTELTAVNGDPTIAECVRARLEGLTFPPTEEGGSFTFNLLFGR